MKQSSLPNYTKMCQILKNIQPPAQVHGMICGMLCGYPAHPIAWDEWLKKKISPAASDLLQALYTHSKKQLEEFLFEFELVLPSDKTKLPARAEALTLWCQGALTGLQLADIPIEHRKPGEATEAIDDLIEIAKMNYEQVVASEEDEAAYVELVEYVRMGIVLIYQEQREREGGNKRPIHSHH